MEWKVNIEWIRKVNERENVNDSIKSRKEVSKADDLSLLKLKLLRTNCDYMQLNSSQYSIIQNQIIQKMNH